MKCKKCGKEIDVTEANEYYYKGKVIPARAVDMYGNKVTVVCQKCL